MRPVLVIVPERVDFLLRVLERREPVVRTQKRHLRANSHIPPRDLNARSCRILPRTIWPSCFYIYWQPLPAWPVQVARGQWSLSPCS
jgi:hypothetical protein